jgi:sterol desaturase/sphingolipid hydroxylase (fatty acid hydroxylase superfamily)
MLVMNVIMSKALILVVGRLMQFWAIAYIFLPAERLIPFHPKQRLFRAYLGLDLLHYFVGGIFIIVFVQATYLLMPLLAGWLGIHGSPLSVRHLPGWMQFLVFEAGWTFLGYWLHRLEHVWAPLWRMHSIHESVKEIDWLSAFRLHPLEPVLFQVLTIMPLWLFEMSIPAATAYSIYSYITAHVQHANIVFPIGPLKYVFPTPEFHRWHHARVYDSNGLETQTLSNFGQYPIWDLLFGTFYLPKDRPVAYGSAEGDKVPTDYLAQLVYPFGWHETVLAWERRFWQRFQWQARFVKMHDALRPVHEGVDNWLARLCLLRQPDGVRVAQADTGTSINPGEGLHVKPDTAI